MTEIERLCRIICKAEGVDPDAIGVGCGHHMPAGARYPLWEARRRVAAAIIEDRA